MNFLDLCNRLKRKCRISGAAMTDVTGQVEEYSRVVDWINEAWMDLQLSREDWMWMRTSASCTTVLGQATYSPTTDFHLTDFGNWARDTFRNYVTASGNISEIPTPYMPYDQWRDQYQLGGLRYSYSRPSDITITPTLAIGCGPVPIAGYTITGDYYKVASELSAKTDTPALPAQFHMAIVYRAMMYYGASEAATEIYQEGQIEYARMMRMLVSNQLPDLTTGRALA